jgi:hypothetical protein
MTVYIKGRDVIPTARLLDALARSGLLSERVTWEETGDRIKLTIHGASEEDLKTFQQKKDYIVFVD